MKNVLHLLLFVISFSVTGLSQTITFDKSLLAGTATQVLQTDNGGYLLYCPTFYPYYVTNDITFIKTDQFGFTESIKYYTDMYTIKTCRVISKTYEGGYIAIASKINGLFTDVYVIKFDQNLDTLWTKTFGNLDQREFGHSIIQLPDSSFIFSSLEDGDKHIRKIDKNGDLIWNKIGGYYWIF